MRHFGMVSLAVAAMFAFNAVLAAQTTPAAVRVAGQLTKIDGKALTITTTVSGLARDTIITCNDATKFSRDGDKPGTQLKFEDLKVGQQVRAYYTKAENIALAVIIAAAPATNTAK